MPRAGISSRSHPVHARPGDVLVFRYRLRSAAKHLGVLSGPDTLIHACEGAPACEIALSPWWRRRITAAFRFPAIATDRPSAA